MLGILDLIMSCSHETYLGSRSFEIMQKLSLGYRFTSIGFALDSILLHIQVYWCTEFAALNFHLHLQSEGSAEHMYMFNLLDRRFPSIGLPHLSYFLWHNESWKESVTWGSWKVPLWNQSCWSSDDEVHRDDNHNRGDNRKMVHGRNLPHLPPLHIGAYTQNRKMTLKMRVTHSFSVIQGW